MRFAVPGKPGHVPVLRFVSIRVGRQRQWQLRMLALRMQPRARGAPGTWFGLY
jgi:hypothetical protein